jgi:restriction system protein
MKLVSGSLITLSEGQLAFVHGFVSEVVQRTRLMAGPGTGKTIAAAVAALERLAAKSIDSVVVLTDRQVLAAQWKGVLAKVGLVAADSADEFGVDAPSHVVATGADLLDSDTARKLIDAGSRYRQLIVLDEANRSAPSVQDFVDSILSSNDGAKFLSIQSPHQEFFLQEMRAPFDREYFLDQAVLLRPETGIEIARFSPSHDLLQSIFSRSLSIDDLSWRQFERLVAQLLESGGYEVELMRGTKDGGVDIIAVADLGPLGLFKTLWQAKKHGRGRKVGLSVVRELADTKNEFGASKAYIVTSTFLTRDAVQRIERDRYILGKVDRIDLENWISSVLMKRHGVR